MRWASHGEACGGCKGCKLATMSGALRAVTSVVKEPGIGFEMHRTDALKRPTRPRVQQLHKRAPGVTQHPGVPRLLRQRLERLWLRHLRGTATLALQSIRPTPLTTASE